MLQMQKPRRGDVPPNDVKRGSADQVAARIIQCLKVKGYCVISEGFAKETLEQAQNEIGLMEADGKFNQPAILVQDGLLGTEGSNRIAEVEPVDWTLENPSESAPDGATIRDLDLAMWTLTTNMETYQHEIGIRTTSRTQAHIHMSGTPVDETTLTDKDASKWVSLLVRQKVMILIFVGPTGGTMDLKPHDDDSNSFEMSVVPGMMLVIRSDKLAFSFTARGSQETSIMSCFLLQDDIIGMHKNQRMAHMTPAATELENWINARLKQLKDSEDEDTVWDDSIPRHFILAMNHHYYKRQLVAVRGLCTRVPTTWESNTFFLALCSGPDLVTQVPIIRWDHDTIYDASQDCWQLDPPKTNCQHAAFCDGVDLFDNKRFGLSINEVKSMDPSQRLVLEVTYEALFLSGMKKNTLLNSTCGMYVGNAVSEWNYAERSADVGIFGATGGAPSITAGRLSFCLGVKGASLAIDTDCASSLTATYWACESVEKKGRGTIQQMACGIGVNLMLAKAWWPAHSAAGFLCPEGRCFTFDSSARGYVRGDGCCTAVVRNVGEVVDGVRVDDELPLVGLISGGSNNNSGKTANLSAPSGPAIQQVITEAVRAAGITPLDMDVVECHGTGSLLGDAVELSSCAVVLRGEDTEEVLGLGSVKTNTGCGIEAAGITSLCKTLKAAKWGYWPANIHLNQLNPHMEMNEMNVFMNTECVEFRMRSAFCGVTARGFGGTNVHIISFGNVDNEIRPPPEPMDPEKIKPAISFWPAGGGDLNSSARPKRGYSIVGSWSNYEEVEDMEAERGDDGTYGYTVTMGENGWEQFYVLIDGDEAKVLHPQRYKAPKGTLVCGPDKDIRYSTWIIETRTELFSVPVEGGSSGEDGTVEEKEEGDAEGNDDSQERVQLIELGTDDRGKVGEQYRIKLHVSGKYRTVTWAKLEDPEGGELPLQPVTTGKYYLVADWCDWEFEEMEAHESVPGLFTLEVTLPSGCGEFQIVRNKDWRQTMFPPGPRAGGEAAIHGPDDRLEGYNWLISGKRNSTFRIEFQRIAEFGQDMKKLSWREVSQ